jgi:transcriptional regulator MraZ
MFRGATKVTLDEKGRMVMPTRYREQLVERAQGRVVVTVDSRDRCLLIYPLPEWELIEGKLMSLPTLKEEARRLTRLMIGHAVDFELDGHGRILLPQELREFAGLERHGMLIGLGRKFELWSESSWAERLEEMLKSGKATTGLPSELDSLSL